MELLGNNTVERRMLYANHWSARFVSWLVWAHSGVDLSRRVRILAQANETKRRWFGDFGGLVKSSRPGKR